MVGVGGDTYTNPVIDSDNPDPAALALPTGGFIVVTTHGTWASDDAFSIYFSTDLVNWQHQGYIFQGRPSVQRLKIQNFKLKDHLKKHKKILLKKSFVTMSGGEWPGWCDHNMWAPEIQFIGGRYVAYFSCAAANGRRSVGVAVSQSDSYLGPYKDIGVPLVYHNEDSVVGCLDQTYFKDPATGKSYLIWKTDKLVPLIIGVIYIQELEENGIAMKNGSSKVKILQVDQ